MRGLRNSIARQCLSAIVSIMLAASTVYVILGLYFCILQVPSAMGQDTPPEVVYKLKVYNVASNWLSRLNVSAQIAAYLIHRTDIGVQ